MTVTAKVVDRRGVTPGLPVLLDGRQSQGATGHRWEIEGDPRGARLLGPHAETIQFEAVEAGEYQVRLTVTDGTDEDSAVALVEVTAYELVLSAPVEASVGQPAVFTATCSNAPSNAAFLWRFEDPSPETDPFVKVDGASARVLPWKPGPHKALVTLRVPDPRNPGRWRALAAAEAVVDVQPPPRDAGGGIDEAWWQDKLITDTRGALSSVVAAANTWQGYTATLLGLFGTVTIVAGPEALADLSKNAQRLLIVITALGFVSALVGLWLLSRVTAKAPDLGPAKTGEQYKEETLGRVARARQLYSASKAMTISAAVLIAVGSLVAASSAAWTETSEEVLVLVRTETDTFCGALSSTEAGQVQVAGVDLDGTEAVTVVASCGAGGE